MIDIHCHLISRVDDGPQTMEEGIALCRASLSDGVTHAICNPHSHTGRFNSSDKFDKAMNRKTGNDLLRLFL